MGFPNLSVDDKPIDPKTRRRSSFHDQNTEINYHNSLPLRRNHIKYQDHERYYFPKHISDVTEYVDHGKSYNEGKVMNSLPIGYDRRIPESGNSYPKPTTEITSIFKNPKGDARILHDMRTEQGNDPNQYFGNGATWNNRLVSVGGKNSNLEKLIPSSNSAVFPSQYYY